MMPRLQIPFIRFLELPENDQQNGMLLQEALKGLCGDIEEFNTALELAQHCDEERGKVEHSEGQFSSMKRDAKYIPWKMLAIRHAAVVIYNFRERWNSVNNLTGRNSPFFQVRDRRAAREAELIFKKSFPSFSPVRQVIAHGDQEKSAAERMRHVIPGTSFVLRHYSGDTFQTFVDGTAVAYSLAQETLDSLGATAAAIFRSCLPIADLAIAYAKASRTSGAS